MNIVFTYPTFPSRGVALHYPLGLVTVANIARDLGHSIQIIDLNLDKMSELTESLKGTDAICYSGMVTTFDSIMALNQCIKNAYPGLLQIIGGPITLVLKKEFLLKGDFNFISIGSGEFTMPAILDMISGKPLVNASAVKEKNTQIITAEGDFREIYRNSAFPDITLLKYKRYTNDEYLFRFLPEGYCANLETSRGCPYKCTFCDKSVWGNRWVGRSAQDMAKQMFYLYEKLNINKFHMVDDLFIFNKKRVLELCRLLS
ncbi:MAG: B12-binding domain-containing radical SAM protein, partial [Planctomycetota bacterium]